MRIAVFIDYWNFQLTLNEKVSKLRRVADPRVRVDWKRLGQILAAEACTTIAPDGSVSHTYEGCYIYTSYNPALPSGKTFATWASNTLDRFPGVNVHLRERRRKSHQRCPVCHAEITHCPHNGCGKPIEATEEKGVDTLLVTDLLRYGHLNAYDTAVLGSLDADMIPAVTYMQSIGKKIIQAGFPPKGIDLATECWGSFDVLKLLDKIERK